MHLKHITAVALLCLAAKCSGSVLVGEYGAKGDGVSDDAGAFQAALGSGQEVHVPRGTYRLNEPLVFTSGMTLVGEDNPTLYVYGVQGFVFNSSYDWVEIRGFKIYGNNQDIFCLINSTYQVRLTNCTIYNGHCGVVQEGGQVGDIYCTGLIWWNMSGPCWWMTGGSGLWITDCTVIQAIPGVEELFASGYGAIVVRDYNAYQTGPMPYGGNWAFYLYDCFDIQFDQVTLDGMNTGGFYCFACSGMEWEGVKAYGIQGTGILLNSCWDSTFTNCDSSYSVNGYGLLGVSCDNINFNGLLIWNALGNSVCAGITQD